MKLPTLVLGLIVVGILDDDSLVKQEKDRLQGTWVVTKTTMNDREIKDRGLSGSTFTFRGDELTMDGHEGKERHTFKLDTASAPKAMFTNRVEPARPQSGWMIYELRGDQLTIGFNDALQGRPERFAPRRKLIVIELVRKVAKEHPSKEAPSENPLSCLDKT
jgi:uncharacterized protein (TIGR03067 family)